MLELFIMIGASFLVAGVLIVFISLHDSRMKKQNPVSTFWPTNVSTGESLDIRGFSKICLDLCETLKLDITDVQQPSANEFVARAVSQNPITRVEFLICGFLLPENEMLDSQNIQEISEQVVSERISKAIIITTGKIDAQNQFFAEQAPIEFIDGEKLKQLIREHKPI